MPLIFVKHLGFVLLNFSEPLLGGWFGLLLTHPSHHYLVLLRKPDSQIILAGSHFACSDTSQWGQIPWETMTTIVRESSRPFCNSGVGTECGASGIAQTYHIEVSKSVMISFQFASLAFTEAFRNPCLSRYYRSALISTSTQICRRHLRALWGGTLCLLLWSYQVASLAQYWVNSCKFPLQT